MHFYFQISDPDKCDQMYESLARINSNLYRERVSTSDGAAEDPEAVLTHTYYRYGEAAWLQSASIVVIFTTYAFM